MPNNSTPRPAVSSADLLAPGPETPRVDPRFKKRFDQLNLLREELARERAAKLSENEASEPNFTVNIADRATEEYDTGASYSRISNDQEVLYEIDQALERIRNGTYGICEVTGERIPEDRLDAIPWTRFARDVEEQVEREKQSRKPRHAF